MENIWIKHQQNWKKIERTTKRILRKSPVRPVVTSRTSIRGHRNIITAGYKYEKLISLVLSPIHRNNIITIRFYGINHNKISDIVSNLHLENINIKIDNNGDIIIEEKDNRVI